jgi:riboflavin transporter FmnP
MPHTELPESLMNTKSIALIITFAAVAIALNAVRIPSVFDPGASYQFSQIPIIVAFLLFGVRIGFSVGILNMAGGMLLFSTGPTTIITYPMGLVSVLVMFAGLYAGSRFITKNGKSLHTAIGLTFFAVVLRGFIMPFVDYGVLYHVLVPLVLGVSLPEAFIAGLIPAFILYNVTVPLYTIPLAYVVATKVGNHLKMEPRFLRWARAT